ncbi:hypothetical protein MNBD_PLANCTO02-2323 [hydrothermal vent metagenome]|uniref:Uncharacterized protein n=1 Tax=hydrothermal vent metagenome TaxID=652676 RepID=A0A3B1DMS9_9ZZZZ
MILISDKCFGILSTESNLVAKLNKKQKKQIEVARKKLEKLHKLRSDAKQQNDDPAELAKLEADIEKIKTEIETIQNG